MASKTTGTKKNAKQSTAKKRQPTKKTSAKSAKSAKTTRKNTTSKAVPQEESFLATEILIWVTPCGRDSEHNQQFRTCRCIWKKDCSTAAGNDGLDGVCISTAFILWSRVCGFQ